MNNQQNCWCGNPSTPDNCCGPIIDATANAQTAEQLMRSRFSAFCCGNIDYLISSHHPSKRQADDRQTLEATISQCKWLRLDIVNTENGQVDDEHGQVEYIATYTQHNELYQLREDSAFVKENHQWFYLEGSIFGSGPLKVKMGRNDPCGCGSGKKYKKCHG